jgi:hypothetical protein
VSESRVAFFIGGPLDGTEREVLLPIDTDYYVPVMWRRTLVYGQATVEPLAMLDEPPVARYRLRGQSDHVVRYEYAP